MKEIREANLAFVSLLTQLKRFISEKGTVAIAIRGEEHVLPTIPSIIEAYRNGEYDELILKQGGKEIHLQNNDGALRIVDKDGNLVNLEVASLRYSMLEDCVFDSVTAESCTITMLESLGSVNMERANCQNLTITNLLTAQSGSFQDLNVALLNASSAFVHNLTASSIVFNPNVHRNVFATTVPYNYASGNAAFEDVAGGLHAYMCQPPELSTTWKDPSTMGFVELPAPGNRLMRSPDMVTYCGNTRFSDYNSGSATRIANCYAIGTGPYGAAVEYSQAFPIMSSFDGPCCPFALILGWPIRSFVRNPADDPELPSVMRSYAKGTICLHEFSTPDIGRIIYIRTLSNSWKIPRRLIARYSNGKLQRAVLDLEYEIPPYTALRVRLNRYAVQDGDNTDYHNVLELT